MTSAAFLAVLATVWTAAGAVRMRPGGEDDRNNALTSLIEAERAFSKASEEKGIRDAFLTYLAEKAIVFRPGPVLGRPVYEKMDPANQAALTWLPEVAEVSAGGDLGWTSGPYQLRKAREEKEPSGYGHYVSVWRRQPDGSWKVILDIGVAHDPQQAREELSVQGIPPGQALTTISTPESNLKEERLLAAHGMAFLEDACAMGYRNAYKKYAENDLRLLRPGHFPVIGIQSLKAMFKGWEGQLGQLTSPGGKATNRSRVLTAMAVSADLGATYGTTEIWKGRIQLSTSSYLRIWRKKASRIWRMCLDIELPIPQSAWKD
jgi:ketosteroid isomerase-like protein